MKPERWLTVCFDDGIRESVDIVTSMTDEKFSFFVVTGWLDEFKLPIKDPFNVYLDHGNVEYWRHISELGHTVGGHTHTHPRLNPNNALVELTTSLKIIKTISPAPYICAYPYVKVVKSTYGVYDWVRPFVGFPNAESTPIEKDCAVMLRGFEEAEKEMESGNMVKRPFLWSCFGFHGFNFTGWQPVPTGYFQYLLNFCSIHDIKLVTMTEAYLKFKEAKNDKLHGGSGKEGSMAGDDSTKDSA